MENLNNKHKKLELYKVEEPVTIYNSDKAYVDIIDHPLFAKVIEKSKKDALDGEGLTTEEVMKSVIEKYPFLK